MTHTTFRFRESRLLGWQYVTDGRPLLPAVFTGPAGFLRHRGTSLGNPVLERRAMLDSSSDTSATSPPRMVSQLLIYLGTERRWRQATDIVPVPLVYNLYASNYRYNITKSC